MSDMTTAPTSTLATLPDSGAKVTVHGTTDLKRKRLAVLFRSILLIPHSVVLGLAAIGFIFAWGIGWLCAIFIGHLPGFAHRYATWIIRYQFRVRCYQLLLTDVWPPFGTDDPYLLDVSLPAEPVQQSRLSILFRGILSIPAVIIFYVLAIGAGIVYLLMWLSGLFAGKVPAGMLGFVLKVESYSAQFSAYYLSVTNVYPKYEDVAGFVAPVEA